jgi:hypothetical protein
MLKLRVLGIGRTLPILTVAGATRVRRSQLKA